MRKGQRRTPKSEIRHARTEVTPKGRRNTKLYQVWLNMHQRCGNPECPQFSRWGARGIYVCKPWKDFDIFADWMVKNEWAPGRSLDRIDNEGIYEPSNCQIVSISENCAKTSTTPLKIASNKRNAQLAKAACSLPVRCVETGEIFASGRLAAESLGRNVLAVNVACRTGGKCGGYHWERA